MPGAILEKSGQFSSRLLCRALFPKPLRRALQLGLFLEVGHIIVAKRSAVTAFRGEFPQKQRQSSASRNSDGTFEPGGSVYFNDYATTARTKDGTLVMSYLPTLRTVSVDMASLSAMVTARWFDPSNGVTTPIAGSPFLNSGTRTFAPTGNNRAGAGDWVLLLETDAKP
jgi:hypothetical protein